MGIVGFREFLGEADTSVHRALMKLGYKRPTEEDGTVKPKNAGVYQHARGKSVNSIFNDLNGVLTGAGYKHVPRYNSEMKCLNHTWQRGGSKISAVHQYMKGHALSVEEDTMGGVSQDGVAANNAGDGNIQGMGVGPKGEPGVSKRKQREHRRRVLSRELPGASRRVTRP